MFFPIEPRMRFAFVWKKRGIGFEKYMNALMERGKLAHYDARRYLYISSARLYEILDRLEAFNRFAEEIYGVSVLRFEMIRTQKGEVKPGVVLLVRVLAHEHHGFIAFEIRGEDDEARGQIEKGRAEEGSSSDTARMVQARLPDVRENQKDA